MSFLTYAHHEANELAECFRILATRKCRRPGLTASLALVPVYYVGEEANVFRAVITELIREHAT